LASVAWGVQKTLPLPLPDNSLPRQIRVLVANDLDGSIVRGIDLRAFQKRVVGLGASADLHALRDEVTLPKSGRKSEWRVRCTADFVELRSGSAIVRLKAPASIESPAGFLQLDGRPYRETLWFFPASGKRWGCEAVNEVNVEEYLNGLVNSEFSAQWKPEAVAAQVVAARTYALHQILQARLKNADYDVHGTEKDQVYEGAAKEHFLASRVVDQTRGMVLVSRDGKKTQPIKAFYHSTCGGHTELPEKVWGVRQSGFGQRVTCPFCTSSPRFRWNLSVARNEVEGALKRKLLGKNGSWLGGARLARVETVGHRGPAAGTDRLSVLRTVWEFGKVTRELNVKASEFRNWLGAGRLKSTAFAVARTPSGDFRFEGRGNGHGVGMCQWGAKVMGEKGYTMAGILKFYYPDAELKKLW